MAIIEKDGKQYARCLWINLADNEWGNDLMDRVARAAFAADATLEVVHVTEHGGWYLEYLRDGTIVSTANDQAQLSERALSWWRHGIYSYESAGYISRGAEHAHV